ncbi:MAG: hypothetical protein LUE86_14475 [Clostridiales bacterium]|nr:hypothetical protein [Clostridiales bacterium]
MGNRVLKRIAEYLKAHRRKKNWQIVLTSLAAVVVFCTTYALVLPALTLEWPGNRAATASDAKIEDKPATPGNVTSSTTTDDDDPEAEVDLIFDLDYDLSTRRFLTKSARDLGVDVDMGVPEWMLSDWNDVPDFEGELTGVWSQDLLTVAESQVGYIADYEGRSYYGDWYGKPYDDWNAMFVSWCLDMAEVPENVIPREISAADLAESLLEMDSERFVGAGNHTPEAGDLIFLDTDGDGETDRVGIVAEYNARTGELKVIEGDYRTEVEWYETETELASASNAEKATPSNAKKASASSEAEAATQTNTQKTEPGRGGGAGIIPATPSDAEKTIERVSPLGATIEKKETFLVTATEEDDDDEEDGYSYDIISEAAIVSYSLEELLAGEESVSVVAYATGLTAGRTTNIVGYATSYTINVSDAENNTVVADSDGNYNLTEGETYTIGLNFEFTEGITQGTYTYTFPEGTTLNNSSGTLVSSGTGGDIEIGTWTIDPDTRTITFVVTENANNLTNVTISASVSATFNNAGDEIPLGDITYKVVEDTTDTTSDLHKRSKSIDTDSGKITWEVQVDGGTDTGLAGQVITDTLSTSNHSFTAADSQSMTITIWDPDVNEYHTLSISDEILTYTTSGWSITLPSTFYCSDCSKTITLPTSDSTGWIVYVEYTTTISDTSVSYATYGNKVVFNNAEETGTASVGDGGIDKSGIYNAGTATDWSDTTVTWTIDVAIPGGKVYSWYFYDSEYVYIDGSGRVQRYYNALGVDSTTTTIIAEINGTTYDVPNLSDAATDGSDLIAWELYKTGTTDGYEYGRYIRFYTWDSSTNSWSLWWNIDSVTTLTITYTSSVVYDTDGDGVIEDTDENLIQEYNTRGASLRNNVQLYNLGTDGNSETFVTEATAKVDLPSVLDKELTEAPTSSNNWTTEFTVTFNETMANLSQYNEVTLTDTMSSTLVFEKDSIVITAEDANGKTFAVSADDYTVEYTSGTSNVATITLTGDALGPYKYTLVYTAVINGSGQVTYSNEIEVTILGTKYNDTVSKTTEDSVTSSYEQYSVTLKKTDKESGEALSDATFDVYNASTGAKLATVTTGTDGTATVTTDTTNGIIFHAHTLYYFIETDAPTGYQLDNTTKYYFWFCNATGSTCDTCNEMTENYSGATYEVGKDNITVTVTNAKEQTYELPSAGGTGILPYTMTGLLLTGCACLMYKDTRRKRDLG